MLQWPVTASKRASVWSGSVSPGGALCHTWALGFRAGGESEAGVALSATQEIEQFLDQTRIVFIPLFLGFLRVCCAEALSKIEMEGERYTDFRRFWGEPIAGLVRPIQVRERGLWFDPLRADPYN